MRQGKAIIKPQFIRPSNIISMIRQVSLIGILSMGVMPVIINGGVSMKGGVGNVFGVVIGVLIMGALQNGLNIMGVSPYWQQICKGLAIIVAVVADTMKKGTKQ